MNEFTSGLTLLCTQHGLKIQATQLHGRPDSGWGDDPKAGHFFVRIYRVDQADKREITTTFSQGSGHRIRRKGTMVHPKPKVADVLECLLLDAMGTSESFCDWADNFGYDRDSIKALETYKACCQTRQDLETFLGPDLDAFFNAENDIT